jgi:hypothetical protein
LSIDPVQASAVEVPTKVVYAIVISHDCEFNEGKRDQFLAARTRQLDPRLEDDEIDALRLGNRILDATATEVSIAVDTFFLEPIPGRFEEPRIVDFCTITPFPMKLLNEAMRCKCAELQQEHRVYLREKLALFFGRQADDVPEDQKFDPGERE